MRDLAAKGHTKNFEPPNLLQLLAIRVLSSVTTGFRLAVSLLSELFFSCPINFRYDLRRFDVQQAPRALPPPSPYVLTN
jgi:hypothetical protein